MVKRIIGILGTLIVLAIVVFTILERGRYSSAIEWSAAHKSTTIETVEVDSLEVEGVDTLNLVVE